MSSSDASGEAKCPDQDLSRRLKTIRDRVRADSMFNSISENKDDLLKDYVERQDLINKSYSTATDDAYESEDIEEYIDTFPKLLEDEEEPEVYVPASLKRKRPNPSE